MTDWNLYLDQLVQLQVNAGPLDTELATRHH